MIVGVLFLAIPLIGLLLAIVSLALAAAVMTRAPLRWRARAAVALVALVIGFAPIAVLIIAAASWPAGE